MILQREKIHSFDFNEDYDNVEFFSVLTTDCYRPGRSYKLFRYCGVSEVKMTFDLPEKVKKPKSLHLTVTEGCWPGMMDIFLNDRLWIEKHTSVGPNWQVHEVTLAVDWEWLKPNGNIIAMKLREDAENVYWLADATIEVSHLVPSTLVEITANAVADMIKNGQIGEHVTEDRKNISSRMAKEIKEWMWHSIVGEGPK